MARRQSKIEITDENGQIVKLTVPKGSVVSLENVEFEADEDCVDLDEDEEEPDDEDEGDEDEDDAG